YPGERRRYPASFGCRPQSLARRARRNCGDRARHEGRARRVGADLGPGRPSAGDANAARIVALLPGARADGNARDPHDRTARRRAAHVDMEARRGIRTMMDERSLSTLPADLPVPLDDGAAAHLDGMRLPHVELPATDGSAIDL